MLSTVSWFSFAFGSSFAPSLVQFSQYNVTSTYLLKTVVGMLIGLSGVSETFNRGQSMVGFFVSMMWRRTGVR